MRARGQIFVVGLIVALCIPLSAAAKKTPDGQTPADETVCNALLDGTHGMLYGECVAFCEAQDCDQQDVYTRSCQRLLRNFMRKSDGVVIPCLQRLVSDNAIIVDEEEFESLVADGDLIPLTGDEVEVQNAREQAQMAEDIATIEEFNRLNEADIPIPQDPDDPTVTKLSDGSYLHWIPLKNGMSTEVITLGRRWMISRIADAIRTFDTFDNQLAMYESSYRIIRENEYGRLDEVLIDPEEIRAHPDEFSVEDIVSLNELIAEYAEDIISVIPVFPGLITPGDCSTDVGNGTGGDRGKANVPAYQPCETDPDGIFQNYAWNGKFDHTCVKDQWRRGTCVAFAVTAAAEYRVKQRHGLRVNLSEQAFYNRMKLIWERMDYGDGFTNTKAWQESINEGYLHPFEYQWNYNSSADRVVHKVGDTVVGYSDSCLGYTETCSDTTHQSALFCFLLPSKPALTCGYLIPIINPDNYGFRLKSAWQLWDPDTKSSVQSVNLTLLNLASGNPVMFGIPVTPEFDKAGDRTGAQSGVVHYVLNEDPVTFRGGHALLAVGYLFNSDLPPGVPEGAGGGYIIVKNSWSACWGDGGYAYMPFEYYRIYAVDADVLFDVY